MSERVRELLVQAKELWEMDVECSTVGTDAWVWLKHTEEVLNGGPTRTMAEATKTEMQNLLGQGYGAIQQQLAQLLENQRKNFECHASNSVQQYENLLRLISIHWDSQAKRSAAIEEKLGQLPGHTDIAVLAHDLENKYLIPRAMVGERLRHVAKAYLAGGHSHRAKMLNALANEFDPAHTDPAVAMTETPRRVGRKPARKVRKR